MTADYIAQLIDFHYWARDRMLAAVGTLTVEQYERPMGSSFSSVRDTVNHVFQAEWIWFQRWNGVSPSGFKAGETPDVASLTARWTELEGQLRAYVAARNDDALRTVLAYRLMSGKEGASPLWQMIVHVVNHATYHRGQVTTLLRQLGAAPAPSTDMITFFRERAT